jgi:hypothetical protein
MSGRLFNLVHDPVLSKISKETISSLDLGNKSIILLPDGASFGVLSARPRERRDDHSWS